MPMDHPTSRERREDQERERINRVTGRPVSTAVVVQGIGWWGSGRQGRDLQMLAGLLRTRFPFRCFRPRRGSSCCFRQDSVQCLLTETRAETTTKKGSTKEGP